MHLVAKDVTAKCHRGDVTRKRKPLNKQKEGKERTRLPEAALAAIRDRQGRHPAGGVHRRAEGRCVGLVLTAKRAELPI
jgi:hypothetical protein